MSFEVGGSICKDRLCGWESADWACQKCPRCGSWCRYWHAEVEDVAEAQRARQWADGHWYAAQMRQTRYGRD